jgi:L-ascorbate metabolism protein UlaG (beta-lactamase superfamily)
MPLMLAAQAPAAQTYSVKWLGHAAFEVVSPGGTRLLIDPFLSQNPTTPADAKDLSKYKPNTILVTHSHGDHLGDTVAIAKASGAPVITAFELATTLGLPEAQVMGGNVGGAFTVGDTTIHLVPAMHGSEPGGRPVGFVIRFKDGRSIYHTGDTWIFGDMALIEEIFHPETLLFNMGGGPFTQDPTTAALAVKKYFKPKYVVPMHFGTFPPLSKEADIKKAFGADARLVILKPGESKAF